LVTTDHQKSRFYGFLREEALSAL